MEMDIICPSPFYLRDILYDHFFPFMSFPMKHILTLRKSIGTTGGILMFKKWREKLLKRCRELLPKKRLLES
jgi:hypothetical protein